MLNCAFTHESDYTIVVESQY